MWPVQLEGPWAIFYCRCCNSDYLLFTDTRMTAEFTWQTHRRMHDNTIEISGRTPHLGAIVKLLEKWLLGYKPHNDSHWFWIKHTYCKWTEWVNLHWVLWADKKLLILPGRHNWKTNKQTIIKNTNTLSVPSEFNYRNCWTGTTTDRERPLRGGEGMEISGLHWEFSRANRWLLEDVSTSLGKIAFDSSAPTSFILLSLQGAKILDEVFWHLWRGKIRRSSKEWAKEKGINLFWK